VTHGKRISRRLDPPFLLTRSEIELFSGVILCDRREAAQVEIAHG
jgi:hypothetical protein